MFVMNRLVTLTSREAGRSEGKSPSPLAMAGLAPYAIRRATISLSRRPAATCSGVFPEKVAALTLMLFSNRKLTRVKFSDSTA